MSDTNKIMFDLLALTGNSHQAGRVTINGGRGGGEHVEVHIVVSGVTLEAYGDNIEDAATSLLDQLDEWSDIRKKARSAEDA